MVKRPTSITWTLSDIRLMPTPSISTFIESYITYFDREGSRGADVSALPTQLA